MAGGMMMLPDTTPYKREVGESTDGKDAPVPTNLWFLYLLTGCSTIGGFLFGYDTGVISGALVLLKSPDVFNLTDFQSESVVSVAVVGAIMGAALSSFGNHAFGRKPVILVSSLFFTVGSILMGFGNTFEVLLIGRFVVGLGLGLSSMTVPLYIAEVSPPQIRGRLVSLNTVLVTGGQFFACVLAALLSRSHDGWRYMLGLAAIPAAIQLVGFLLLPESPRYLISKGKKKAAWAALVQIRGTDNVEMEYNLIETDIQKNAVDHHAKINVWKELRTPTIAKALVLGCSLQALQQICGINTVMYYGATIIQMAGFADPSTAIWLSAVVSFSNFMFTFVGIYLVERMGRRRLTLFSLAGVVLMLVALGTSFYGAHQASTPVVGSGICSGLTSCFECVAKPQCGVCQSTLTTSSLCVEGSASGAAIASQCPSPQQWLYASCPADSSLAKWLILVALFVYLACFASGMGSMPWTINAEIYPLHVRSFALGVSTSVNWIANLIISFTFLSVIDALAPYGAFWLYAVLAMLGFVYLYQALPETKGLELEEIQQLFERKEKERYHAIDD